MLFLLAFKKYIYMTFSLLLVYCEASAAIPLLPSAAASSLKDKIKFKLLKSDLSEVKRIFRMDFFKGRFELYPSTQEQNGDPGHFAK